MLNKKILVGGAGEEAPHVKLKVGSLTFFMGGPRRGIAHMGVFLESLFGKVLGLQIYMLS